MPNHLRIYLGYTASPAYPKACLGNMLFDSKPMVIENSSINLQTLISSLGVNSWTRLKARLASQPTYLEECNIPADDIDKLYQGIERYDEEFLRTAVDDYLKTCEVPKGNIKKYTEAIFGTE